MIQSVFSSYVVQNEDYTATDPLNVTFEREITFSGALSCTYIVIIDDNALEGLHYFKVMVDMTEPPITIGGPSSARVNIEDNEGILQKLSYSIRTFIIPNSQAILRFSMH